MEAVCVPAHCHQGPRKPSSSTTFALNLHQGRAATGKKSLASMHPGLFQSCPDPLRPCRLWPARLLCQGGGFSRQEYWNILANTGCHTLLEHYFSCCLSCHLPFAPGAARTPAMQTAAPPPHLALTGGKPKSSRAASGANPSIQPIPRGGNKTTIETQGQCNQGRRPKTLPPAVQATD